MKLDEKKDTADKVGEFRLFLEIGWNNASFAEELTS